MCDFHNCIYCHWLKLVSETLSETISGNEILIKWSILHVTTANLWLLQNRSVVYPLGRYVVVDAMRRGTEELLCFQHVLHTGVEELELGPIHRPGTGYCGEKKKELPIHARKQ